MRTNSMNKNKGKSLTGMSIMTATKQYKKTKWNLNSETDMLKLGSDVHDCGHVTGCSGYWEM